MAICVLIFGNIYTDT